MGKEIDYVAMGRRIRLLREGKHLTQEQLAEKCSLSAAHLGHVERGTRPPSLESCVRISKSLQIGMDYLLSGSFSSDDILLSNINALLKGGDKLKIKSIVSTMRAIADKLDDT